MATDNDIKEMSIKLLVELNKISPGMQIDVHYDILASVFSMYNVALFKNIKASKKSVHAIENNIVNIYVHKNSITNELTLLAKDVNKSLTIN